MDNGSKYNDRFYVPLIWVLSVAVPLLVAILMTPGFLPKLSLPFDPFILPALNALINSVVTILLILGFVMIRRKNMLWHRRMMLSAFALSAFFLVSYVLYHLSVGHVSYCSEGPIPKSLYLILLFSHILLSAAIVPMASFSIYRALSERYDRHRKLARITFPIWLYISITGVLLYFCILPCYPG